MKFLIKSAKDGKVLVTIDSELEPKTAGLDNTVVLLGDKTTLQFDRHVEVEVEENSLPEPFSITVSMDINDEIISDAVYEALIERRVPHEVAYDISQNYYSESIELTVEVDAENGDITITDSYI